MRVPLTVCDEESKPISPPTKERVFYLTFPPKTAARPGDVAGIARMSEYLPEQTYLVFLGDSEATFLSAIEGQ